MPGRSTLRDAPTATHHGALFNVTQPRLNVLNALLHRGGVNAVGRCGCNRGVQWGCVLHQKQ